MSLFSVPGWDNGLTPVAMAAPERGRGKRKRSDAYDGDNSGASPTTSTNPNLQKLMRKMRLENGGSKGKGRIAPPGVSDLKAKGPSSKRHSRMEPPQLPVSSTSKAAARRISITSSPTEEISPPHKRLRREESDVLPPSSAGDGEGEDDPSTVLSRIKSKKRKPKRQRKAELANILKDRETAASTFPSTVPRTQSDVTDLVIESSPPPVDRQPIELASSSSAELDGLTTLQREMKAKLSGSRFRMINELLYKSDGPTSHRMMQQDPDVYRDYHSGFRNQVLSWPTNPVTILTSSISSRYPAESTVVADLGCGDASLAKSLSPLGFRVVSYDLVSDGEWVTEADVCSYIPLPGGGDDSSTPRAQIVDVVVFSLSLMGLNWIRSVKEARRVLKIGGRLKIAEVTSRFKDKKAFSSVIVSVGFKLAETHDPSTHFTMFEFEKVQRTKDGGMTKKEWTQIELKAADLLKPCDYKRR